MKTIILVFRTFSALLVVAALFAALNFATVRTLAQNEVSSSSEEALSASNKKGTVSQSENSLYFKYYKLLKSRAKMHKV